MSILGVEEDEDISVTFENPEKYQEYPEANIEFPCRLTGIEAFRWEDYYIRGPGDEDEYRKKKKTYPSYKDTFDLIGLEDDFAEDEGLIV